MGGSQFRFRFLIPNSVAAYMHLRKRKRAARRQPVSKNRVLPSLVS